MDRQKAEISLKCVHKKWLIAFLPKGISLMHHGIAGRKLSRTTQHRQALLINLAKSLIHSGSMQTTLPKAKTVRPFVEKWVTLAKKGDLHATRLLLQASRNDHGVVQKLIKEWAPQFQNRAGGYTRIIKTGFRPGDSAPMAIISFVS
jgi:large subunit ribosomal protein L17